jgi:hypothetical protein
MTIQQKLKQEAALKRNQTPSKNAISLMVLFCDVADLITGQDLCIQLGQNLSGMSLRKAGKMLPQYHVQARFARQKIYTCKISDRIGKKLIKIILPYRKLMDVIAKSPLKIHFFKKSSY